MDIKIYLKLKIWILKHDLKHDEKKDFTLCPSLKKVGFFGVFLRKIKEKPPLNIFRSS
jgi:hypothetical protein